MQNGSIASQRGLVRGAIILVLLLVVGAGVAWYWFLGRFHLPEKPPERKGSVEVVLDYEGRRELGNDPLEQMEQPALDSVMKGGAEAKLHWSKWSAAYVKAKAIRLRWQAAQVAGEVTDAFPPEKYHLDYLHQAQLAEYWRARYVNALED